MRRIGCFALLAVGFVCAASAAESRGAAQNALSGIACANLQFSISPDGSRALLHDSVAQEGGFVSSAPFVEAPVYWPVGLVADPPFWTPAGMVVFEAGDGHIIVDPAQRKLRRVKCSIGASETLRVHHGFDILPRFIGREYFVIAGVERNVVAVDVETGAARIAVPGFTDGAYPHHLYIDLNGREIGREYGTMESDGGSFALMGAKRRSIVRRLKPSEKLEPLFTAEMHALSRGATFLALETKPSGARAIVSVDTRTLKTSVVMKLKGDRAPLTGVSSDGVSLQWVVQFAPSPRVTFTKAAPSALERFVRRFPNATLEFQSQSRDGRARVYKLQDAAGRTRFFRLAGGRISQLVVPCRPH